MGLLDFLIGQGVRTFGNVIYNNSRNIPPRGTVRPNNSRIVSDGKRWVTGLEAQKILEEERQKKITKVFNPKEGKMFTFDFAPSSNNSVVTATKTSDEKPKKVVTTTVSTTPVSTTRVGGFKINDGILPSSGLFIDKAPEVDMLRPIENPDTDSVAFKQPTRQFIRQPSTLNISTPTEGLNVQKVYNKKDTRSWLWSQGIDPYTLTGRQRRKIRNDLNTTGTTNFKINGTPIAKKGSKLIKKEEVCPKCGKVHKAGIGCALAKFYARGGKKD